MLEFTTVTTGGAGKEGLKDFVDIRCCCVDFRSLDLIVGVVGLTGV